MIVSATTKGITVSASTNYKGRFFKRIGSLYLFSYTITITNNSPTDVKLLGRHWFIYDTGDGPSELEGAGVVGEQPTLLAGESYTYTSGCHLRASIGAMKGYYNFQQLHTARNFKVKIPPMQFFATPRLN